MGFIAADHHGKARQTWVGYKTTNSIEEVKVTTFSDAFNFLHVHHHNEVVYLEGNN